MDKARRHDPHIKTIEDLRHYWPLWARRNQLPPTGDWFVWFLRSGRGFGKTRTGAEYVIERARQGKGPIALVGQTKADVRDTMVEIGESSIVKSSPPWFKPEYVSSQRRLIWPNGVIGILYSGDEPDQLRGPQHQTAWVDEPAKFRYPDDAWANLEMGMRVGDPRIVATSTPRPIKLIKELVADDDTVDVSGSSYENIDNLSSNYIKRVIKRYEGTRLGRQELHGAILDDVEGALWTHSLIEQYRVTEHPRLYRVVVGVDPKAAKAANSETGIIAAGLGTDGHVYILADMSLNDTPGGWARQVVTAYHQHRADRIVGEVNNGGDMVEHTIRGVDDRVSYLAVHASRGKDIRAEPIANLYERGMVHHVGMLATLEDQMCSWTPGESSPDRMDALVWAVWALKLHEEKSNLKIVRVGR